MNMKELLQKIGIEDSGTYATDGSYVIDIHDYDEYGRFFSLLESSDYVSEDPETAQITVHTTNLTYLADGYQLILQADLDEDLYKLVVTQY